MFKGRSQNTTGSKLDYSMLTYSGTGSLRLVWDFDPKQNLGCKKAPSPSLTLPHWHRYEQIFSVSGHGEDWSKLICLCSWEAYAAFKPVSFKMTEWATFELYLMISPNVCWLDFVQCQNECTLKHAQFTHQIIHVSLARYSWGLIFTHHDVIPVMKVSVQVKSADVIFNHLIESVLWSQPRWAFSEDDTTGSYRNFTDQLCGLFTHCHKVWWVPPSMF